MLEVFMAGFLGIVTGASLVSFIFYMGYMKERAITQEAADKIIKAVSGEAKQSRTNNVLSLLKNEDTKNKPIN